MMISFKFKEEDTIHVVDGDEEDYERDPHTEEDDYDDDEYEREWCD
jgi:hypothetical protein